MSQIGIRDDRKYAIPLKPDKRSEMSLLRPTDCSKMTGASDHQSGTSRGPATLTIGDSAVSTVFTIDADSQVDTAELLHELGADTEHDTVEVTFRTSGETGAHWRYRLTILVLDGRRLFLNESLLDFGKFGMELSLSFGSSLYHGQLVQNSASLIQPTVTQKPSWRLRAEEDEGDRDDGECDLDSQRRPELSRTVDKAEAVIDPVCRHLPVSTQSVLNVEPLTTPNILIASSIARARPRL